tara:strand:+ start:899 stop:1363 length:465 start_codon:yes stop_codon:yes gene_type:complete
MRTTILLLFIILGCTGSYPVNSDTNKVFNIEGKWKFEELIETKEFKYSQNTEEKNENSLTFSEFFGYELISELPGKSIELKNNKIVYADWIDQNLLDKIDFKYVLDKSNSQIVFSAVSPKDNSQVTIPTKITFVDTDMIWQISENEKIKLTRLE